MEKQFNFKGLTLEKLWALYALHEHGSLIDAARGNETKSSLYTRQIGELGKYFGVELTEKHGNGLVLTEDGHQLVEATKDIFRCILELRERGLGSQQMYRIGAGDSLLRWIVIPAISGLSKNAKLNFRVSNLKNSEIVRGLIDRSLDFGLLRKESLNDNLESELLGTVHYVLCVPSKMAKQFKIKPNAWESAFRKLPLALHVESTYIQSELEAQLTAARIEPNVRLRFESFPSAMTALESGKFATLMIQFPGVQAPTDDYISVSLPCLDHTFREIHLAWLPRMMKRRADAQRVKSGLVDMLKWSRDD